MYYPLASLHALVHGRLHPRRLLKHAERRHPSHKIWLSAHRQTSGLKLSFMQQAMEVKNTAAFTMLVQSCAAGAVSLANRLAYYGAVVNKADSRYNSMAHTMGQYAAIEKKVLRFIRYLCRYFPAHTGSSLLLPHSCTGAAQQQCATYTATLQAALRAAGVTEDFITVALTPLVQFAQGVPMQPLTYGRLRYLRHLTHRLQDCLQNAGDAAAAVTVCLIQNNCNEPAFMQYVLAQWQQQAGELALHEAAEFWSARLRGCTLMLHYDSEGLHPALPSVRDFLLAAVRQEIGNADTPAITRAVQQQAAEPLVTTSLSVTQLAVMLRVLVQCGIIKCSNQSALFRQIASAVRTEKAAKLSAESLRIKYHTPERTTISIVKDCLLQMVSALHKL